MPDIAVIPTATRLSIHTAKAHKLNRYMNISQFFRLVLNFLHVLAARQHIPITFTLRAHRGLELPALPSLTTLALKITPRYIYEDGFLAAVRL